MIARKRVASMQPRGRKKPGFERIALAEMFRRKGLSIADVQRLPVAPDPWNVQLTWSAAEESSYRRWWTRFVQRSLHIPKSRLNLAWFWWALSLGLHSRDESAVAADAHAAAPRRDLPRKRWLSLKAALVELAPDDPANLGGRSDG